MSLVHHFLSGTWDNELLSDNLSKYSYQSKKTGTETSQFKDILLTHASFFQQLDFTRESVGWEGKYRKQERREVEPSSKGHEILALAEA